MYDAWPLGIKQKGAFPSYVHAPEKDLADFLATNVTYFVGAADNCTNSSMRSTCTKEDNVECGVKLQGSDRVERMHLYERFIIERMKSTPKPNN